jgi:MoxR-like ATPase
MAYRSEHQPIYDMFQRFLQDCIVNDKSLLWDRDYVWTLENLNEAKQRFHGNTIIGTEATFWEKLDQQLAGASQDVWMIFGDMFYVYYLVSASIKLKTKREQLDWIVKKGHLPPLPDLDHPIWIPQNGIVRTSQFYAQKYRQLYLIVLFAIEMKLLSHQARSDMLKNGFQDLLDNIIDGITAKTDRGHDMRHAMLCFAYPDRYEPIISTADKRKIIDVYSDHLPPNPPVDQDMQLRLIRNALEQEHQDTDTPFREFYQPNIKPIWRQHKVARQVLDEPAPVPPPAPPLDLQDVESILNALNYTRNIILYGPPGTGKTYLANRAATKFSESNGESVPVKSSAKLIEHITFHQSYGYEDFVEGIRPETTANGDLAYPVKAGVFKRLCERAAQDRQNIYVLIIDEINRGNIAKIFGELITLIEDDKRQSADGKGLVVTLPYSGDYFSIPDNLYIIATMNTADRSIALFDVALRRRFAFLEMLPRPEILDNIRFETDGSDLDLEIFLQALNSYIERECGRDYQIGHSYFMNIPDIETLRFVWDYKVLPLLREYFYSQPEKLGHLIEAYDPEGSSDEDFVEVLNVIIAQQE